MAFGANKRMSGSGLAPLRAIWVAAALSMVTGGADAQWSTYRDPAGFSLELPAGWQVRSNTLTDIAVSDAQGHASALVRARPTRGDLARWLGETYPRTELGMGQFRAEQIRSEGEDVALAWITYVNRQAGMRDILGGTVRLQDAQTGETFETTARDRYYYRVAQADRPIAIGTNTDFKPLPQIDMRRLLQVGVDVPER
jgi:hypothetical protein